MNMMESRTCSVSSSHVRVKLTTLKVSTVWRTSTSDTEVTMQKAMRSPCNVRLQLHQLSLQGLKKAAAKMEDSIREVDEYPTFKEVPNGFGSVFGDAKNWKRM